MKQARLLALVLLAILLSILGAAGLYYASLDADERTALREDLGLGDADSGVLEGSGFIEARMATLSTAEGGQPRRLLVAEGDRVEAGQDLALLDQASLQTELLGAQAALNAAQAKVDALRDAGPSAGELGPATRLAEAELERSRAHLASARYRLEQQTLRAPVAGVILDTFAREGERLPAGAAVLRLGQLDPVRLTIYLPEADLGDLAVGQAAEVEVDAYDHRFDGEVLAIATEPEFTPRSVRTRDERASLVYALTIELPNPDGRLKPGMPADARIDTD